MVVAFVSSFNLINAMDPHQLIENAARPIHSFLCTHLDDLETPIPNNILKYLVETLKLTEQNLDALTRIKDKREKKSYKEYKNQFYPNSLSKKKQTNIRMIQATQLYYSPWWQSIKLKARLYGFRGPQFARSKILPIGVIDTHRKHRINFIDHCGNNYPGWRSHWETQNGLEFGNYPFEKDKDFTSQGSITYGGKHTTYNLLRLLVQCKRIGVLNQLFSKCPQKQISHWWGTSKIDFGRQFKEQLTKHYLEVVENDSYSYQDKEQIFKLLKNVAQS